MAGGRAKGGQTGVGRQQSPPMLCLQGRKQGRK